MSLYDDAAEWTQRCARTREAIDAVREDFVSQVLADLSGDDPQPWTDRIYARLEAMTPKDLALMVVLLLHRDVAAEAERLWSALHTMTPEDVT